MKQTIQRALIRGGFFGALLLLALGAAEGHDKLPLPDRPHYAIEHFGERYGLSAITVISMAQDPQGFLWIGSQTGVYRYDGSEITSFGLAEGLPSLHTTQLLVAPDGKLWARMRKGLARLEGKRFAQVLIPPEFGGLAAGPQSFAVDAAGRLFALTEKGLLLMDPSARGPRLLGPSDGLPEGRVEAIVRAPDDAIWIAGGRRLARIASGSTRAEVLAALELPADRAVALLFDQQRLWVRTLHHFAMLDTASSPPQHLVFRDEGIPGANMAGMPVLDRDGNPMLPSGFGLYCWRGDHWQLVDRKTGLTSSAVFSAFQDRQGSVWVGLAGAGIDRWPGSKQWSGWTDDGGLPDPLILGVVRDPHSRLWVGTNTALSMWDPEAHRWQVWNQANGMTGSGTRTLLLSRDGGLWAFTPGAGLTWFDAASAHPQPIRAVTGKIGAGIGSIALAPDGAVWWSDGDVLRAVRRQEGRFTFDEAPMPEPIQGTARHLSFSSGGVLWTAGPNGLSRREGTRWQRFQKSDGLLDNDVTFVAGVGDSEVWVGYADEDHATRARLTPDGRLDVHHLAKGLCLLGMDRGGNAWIEMDDGAGRFSPDGVLRTFTQSDGLLWDDTNCGAFWQESDGSVLIGTSHGLARYDPAEEELPRVAPTVALTQAQFSRIDHLAETHPSVPHDQGLFEARWAALTFSDPSQVRCRYRLNGLESAFTETSQREARYSAVPPGGYTFEVSCGSPELGWSASPATYSFTIEAPWWRTPWALVAALLALALFVLVFTRLRTRKLEVERQRLETAVEERSGELARANRELEEASLTDPLTGVRNRRFFHSTIVADADQSLRAYASEKGSYSLDHRDLIFYLIDLDHFKEINDTHGHDAGDEVLTGVARRLARIVRQSDLLIRWGGEEFLIVCRAAERNNAAVLAEKILKVVAQEPLAISRGRQVRTTCSVGWAPYPWQLSAECLTIDEVVKLADRGLYRAKELGRNHAVGMLPPDGEGVMAGAAGAEASADPAASPAREIVSAGTSAAVSI